VYFCESKLYGNLRAVDEPQGDHTIRQIDLDKGAIDLASPLNVALARLARRRPSLSSPQGRCDFTTALAVVAKHIRVWREMDRMYLAASESSTSIRLSAKYQSEKASEKGSASMKAEAQAWARMKWRKQAQGASAMNYIGIDIHKKYSVACVQDERGHVVRRERIEGNSVEGFRHCLQE